MIRLSIWPSSGLKWAELCELSRVADRSGWHGLWLFDHLVPTALNERLERRRDCLVLLAGLALRVERLRVGSLVCSVTYRHPAILFKAASTIQEMSDRRIVLGVGAGWDRREHQALGIQFPPLSERHARLEDACAAIRLLMLNAQVRYSGPFVSLGLDLGAAVSAAPFTFAVGGNSRRVIRMAARWADEWNCWGVPERAQTLSVALDEACLGEGRKPASIERSAQANIVLVNSSRAPIYDDDSHTIFTSIHRLGDVLDRYEEAGFDEFVLPMFSAPVSSADRAVFDALTELRL